jgi:hypothetical protein
MIFFSLVSGLRLIHLNPTTEPFNQTGILTVTVTLTKMI